MLLKYSCVIENRRIGTEVQRPTREYIMGNVYHLCLGTNEKEMDLRAEFDFQLLGYLGPHFKLPLKLLSISSKKQLTQLM